MSSTQSNQKLQAYLDRDYPTVVYKAEGGGYVAEIDELPGCITQGETLQEVMEQIADARRAWIEAAYESGEEIPMPRTEDQFSGKFVVRVPKSLHRKLAESARREGASLNQYINMLLSIQVTMGRRRDLVTDPKSTKPPIAATATAMSIIPR